MRVAVVDKKDANLKVDNKTLKIDEQKIPLRLVDTLIIAGSYRVDTNEFIKITKEGISIILLSRHSKESAIVSGANGKNGELKLSQFNALKNTLFLAKYFVREKIQRHAKQLEKYEIKYDLEKINENIKNAKDEQALLGVEGSFSKKYFGDYFKLLPRIMHSGKRTKNPPLDPANALMSYLYMLFYNTITVKLLSFGFEPAIGYLHKPFRSHNALSSDIMELFRAQINDFVIECFKNEILQKSDFTKKGGVYLKYDGRKKLWGGIKELLDKTDPALDAEIANLRSML